MSTSASSSRSSSVATTGRRPTNSGISPNFSRSSGSRSFRISPVLRSSGPAHLGAEADRGALAALRDDLFEPGEGAAADEQDVGRVDLQEFLLRVLAPALRRHRGDRALHDLQERLLHALAGHVAGDRRIVGFARDLVDLVDIDDAALRPLDIVVGRLQQLQDDVLDILADIAGLGQRRRVRHRERHVDDARQRLRQQRLARAGRPDQQDVRLRQLDIVVLRAVRQPLVVVVHRDRQNALGVVLADHVIVENPADIARSRHAVARFDERRLVLLTDDVHAELDAFVADEHGRTRDQLPDLVLALAAEGAVERVFRVATAGFSHRHSITGLAHAGRGRPAPAGGSRQIAGQPRRPAGTRRHGPFKYMCSRRINNQLNPPSLSTLDRQARDFRH